MVLFFFFFTPPLLVLIVVMVVEHEVVLYFGLGISSVNGVKVDRVRVFLMIDGLVGSYNGINVSLVDML